ncbi:hypothetical protein F0562_025427 [Nyssa sinensis]|uniref:Uncharacterized protein n=1 Tax=Nyssa sinensis TaxID=561372 RepID=A0A5J5BFF2_9ASTE|nr:hypothetical protein F0562_025427 [Nyssa sinensis]
MASNQPFNATIIDFQATKDAPHSLQANVLVSKVHGKDGAAMVAQGAAESFSSPIISNARVPNVLCHHDLSKVHGEDGMVMEAQGLAQSVSPSILNANISNVHDPSFLMDSFHGDSSSPSLRGRRNLNNGSHGGRGGGGSSARVACGIQTNKHPIRPAFCGKEGLSIQDQNIEFPLGNRETHGGNGRPTLEQQKGEIRGSIPFVRPTQCRHKGADQKGANNQYPLGTSGTFERAGGPSQDNQKADGTAISSSDLGGNRREAIGDQLVGNVSNQGNEVQAAQGGVSAQKADFSELICSTKK